MPSLPLNLRDRGALIQSLRAGATPYIGASYIQVGRDAELSAICKDLDRVGQGGATFRLIVGDFGSGKTFFINLIRSEALSRQLVVANADLNPGRRLQASGGEARSLYCELTKSLSIRTKPSGGALPTIVEKFITTSLSEARRDKRNPTEVIHDRLQRLSELVMGYDFAMVIAKYWKAYETDDEHLKANAIRWLRGEYSVKTDARAALGVREIISDAAVLDQLKLLACFTRLAGYSGLLICLDELVNLYKLANKSARNNNYEQILRIINDIEQGTLEGLGYILGGTTNFLIDPHRGLFSYPALQSRLADNPFAINGLIDNSGPVIRLQSLSRDQFLELLRKLRALYVTSQDSSLLLPDQGLSAFMNHCERRLGDALFRTPRTMITAFIGLLAILEQNQQSDWRTLLEQSDLNETLVDQASFDDDSLVQIKY